jgi:Ca2+-binding EF-hand superfamily protein
MKLVGFAALALAALPAMAVAQDKPAAEEEKPVTKSELESRLEADYADLDADKDGKVTPDEVKARLVKGAQAEIDRLTKERDASFARFDANGDGSISKEEFDARAKLPAMKEADAKPFLDRFDGNKDGAISKEEFRTPTLTNFNRLDKNKDGTVTEAEIKAAALLPNVKKPSYKETPPIGR